VSRQVTSSSCRRWVARLSANHITPLQRIRALPTNQRLRRVVSISSLKAKPMTPIGSEPSSTAQPKR
jgi:hypothetical protein